MKQLIFILFLFFFKPEPNYTINGTVLNLNNIPVPFSYVYIDNSSIVTYSDVYGNFQIRLQKKEKYLIKISNINYQTFDTIININKKTTLIKINVVEMSK